MTAGTAVIGGTGFLGRRLVGRLAEQGESVVVVSRGRSFRRGALPDGVTEVHCDIADPKSADSLADALQGRRRVVNLAGALLRVGVPRETYTRVHVEGTQRLIDALARHAIPSTPVRLVHVSTTGVSGPTGRTGRAEDDPPAPATIYETTKLEGETLALDARRPGLEVAIARPGLVYGPGDLHLLAWFRAIATQRFRPIAGGTALWQPIHVDDVARGLDLLAHHPGADGQVVHLAGAETVEVRDLAARIAGALGVEPPSGAIAYGIAYAAGAVLESAGYVFGFDPPLSRGRVKTLTEDRVYAIGRAAELLDFTPEIPLDRGLADTVSWYRSERLLA